MKNLKVSQKKGKGSKNKNLNVQFSLTGKFRHEE